MRRLRWKQVVNRVVVLIRSALLVVEMLSLGVVTVGLLGYYEVDATTSILLALYCRVTRRSFI